MKEFIYKPNPNGDVQRIFFGRTFDDFMVNKNRDRLIKIERQYDRSLSNFNLREIYDASDEIIKLVESPDEHIPVIEAVRFIERYVHLYDRDEDVMLRNLLAFKNWTDDLRLMYEQALHYQTKLFRLLDEVRETHMRMKLAQELNDTEAYPSL